MSGDDNKLMNWPIQRPCGCESLNKHKSLMYTASQQQTETLVSSLLSLGRHVTKHFLLRSSVTAQTQFLVLLLPVLHYGNSPQNDTTGKLPFYRIKVQIPGLFPLQLDVFSFLSCSCIDSWSKVKPCCPEHPFDWFTDRISSTLWSTWLRCVSDWL